MHRIALLVIVLLGTRALAADWPALPGPGHVADAGTEVPIVDAFSKAKKLWESADTIPDGRAADISDKAHPTISGGFGSPLIVGRRVYLGYYEPAGEVINKAAHDRAGGPAKKWSVSARDVVHCFDLATGRTVWKKVLAGDGLNLNFGNKAGSGQSPLIHEGKLYYCGVAMRMHCLDAETGAVVWTTPVEPRAAHVDAQVAASLADANAGQTVNLNEGVLLKDVGGRYACNRGYLGFPVWVGGVVVTSDYVQAAHPTGGKRMPLAGAAGFDPATGKQLWRVPRCTSGRFANPMPVTVDGKEYVLAVHSYGSALINPGDGKVLWRSAELNQDMGLPILWKDLVAVQAMPAAAAQAEEKARLERGESAAGAAKGSTWKGFRITLKGPELIWTGAPAKGTPCVVAVRDGMAYPVISGADDKPVVWAMEVATGKGEQFAKPGVAGGEHDNMFTVLVGNRLIACVGGNSGAAGDLRDGYCMFTLGEGGRKLTLGDTWKGQFAWGYANTILPAFKDGVMVYRSNTNLVAVDLRGR